MAEAGLTASPPGPPLSAGARGRLAGRARAWLRAPAALRVRAAGWTWAGLWAWTALFTWLHLPGAGRSWHFFAQGGNLLLSGGTGGGLHLYATHPQLQIGPLTLLASGILETLAGLNGRLAAVLALSMTGPVILGAVWRLLPAAERASRARLLLAGLVFLPVWAEVATQFAHLDDILALGFTVAAAHAVARRHPVWAGLALAAAADAKPWAAAFAVMLLALPRSGRLTAAGVAAAGIALAWLPFIIADPHTLVAARFTIPNDPSSALRAIGVSAARTPWWDRPAQLAGGAALGSLAVWRGRWPAVVLLALSARILLDPGVYAYYTSGVLLGTIMVDLIVTRWLVPWTTLAGAVLLYAVRFSDVIPFTLHELGVLRAAFVAGVSWLVLRFPDRRMIRLPGRHARTAGSPARPAPPSGHPARAVSAR